MTKKNLTVTALAAMLILSMAAFAFAGPGYGRGGCNAGNSAYTQLTPEKQAAVDKIVDKYQGEFQELRTEMWTKHSTLQAMVNGGNADEKKIGKLTKELTNLKQKMWDVRDKMTAELEKETGIQGFSSRGGCQAIGQGGGNCPNYKQSSNRGMGRGYRSAMYQTN